MFPQSFWVKIKYMLTHDWRQILSPKRATFYIITMFALCQGKQAAQAGADVCRCVLKLSLKGPRIGSCSMFSRALACSWLRSSDELADFHIWFVKTLNLLCVTNEVFINNGSFVCLLGHWRLVREVFGDSRVASPPPAATHPTTSALKSLRDLGLHTERINASQLNYSIDKKASRYLSGPAAMLNNEPRE